jgi:hypothetical protein
MLELSGLECNGGEIIGEWKSWELTVGEEGRGVTAI